MKNRLHLAAIFVVTFAIYATLWNAPALTWDDGSNIFNNPYFTMHMWWGVWTDAYYGLYVPVTSTAWAFLFWLGGGETWPFRIFNLTLHLANCGLLFLLLRGLARRWKIESPVAIAFGVGLFALHPLQVETVAWISGGRDLLATFFALAAVAVYFSSKKFVVPQKYNYLAATLLFILALLSKPSVVVLPLVVLALDIYLERRPLKTSLKKMAPWFGLSLITMYLTWLAQAEHFDNNIEWWKRPLVMLEYCGFYFSKLALPRPLSGNYGLTPEKILGRPGFAVFALLVGAGLVWATKAGNRRCAVAGLWFILMLPVLGLIPFGYENISGVADHYAYLPMTAIAALQLATYSRLVKLKYGVALPVLLVAGWAGLSLERTRVWRSDQAFFTNMAKTSPDSYSTALGMSVVMCEDVKNYDEGLKWIDTALKAKPDDILALANRAFCLLNSGRPKDVIAMDFYLERLNHDEMAANQPTAYSSLISSIGTAMIREADYGMGYQYLCEAYRILPSEPNHVNNLQAAAEILTQHGVKPICEDAADPVDPEEPE